MYALFFQGREETVGIFPTKNQALVMGRLLSGGDPRMVVGIFNRPDGSTAICCKFMGGEQVYDGGCCVASWADVA